MPFAFWKLLLQTYLDFLLRGLVPSLARGFNAVPDLLEANDSLKKCVCTNLLRYWEEQRRLGAREREAKHLLLATAPVKWCGY